MVGIDPLGFSIVHTVVAMPFYECILYIHTYSIIVYLPP
jgi:hypothetical protein